MQDLEAPCHHIWPSVDGTGRTDPGISDTQHRNLHWDTHGSRGSLPASHNDVRMTM